MKISTIPYKKISAIIYFITVRVIIISIYLNKKYKKTNNRKVLIIEHISCSNLFIVLFFRIKGFAVDVFTLENNEVNYLKKNIQRLSYKILRAKLIDATKNLSIRMNLDEFINRGDANNFANRVTVDYDEEYKKNIEIAISNAKINLIRFINFENKIKKNEYTFYLIPEFFRTPYASIGRYLISKNKKIYILDIEKNCPFKNLYTYNKKSSLMPNIYD